MEAVDLYEGTLTEERFYSWVQLHLAPLIRPRDVVILDNASMHVHTEALVLIESKGAFVFFLAPYSPDMNPIEEAWSKVKAHLRAQAARTKNVLRESIKTAIKSITHQDILGWFTHAGWTHTSYLRAYSKQPLFAVSCLRAWTSCVSSRLFRLISLSPSSIRRAGISEG